MRQRLPILHHVPGSLDSRKIAAVFAIKGMDWAASTIGGGEAGVPGARIATPVLQLGADFHCGAMAVLLAIEDLQSNPTLFPNGNRGMPLALSFWARRFADDFDRRATGDVFAAHADLIERQLHDGRDFLQGAEAGLADAESFSAVSYCLGRAPDPRRLFRGFRCLPGWAERMTELTREEADIADRDMIASAADTAVPVKIDGPEVRIAGQAGAIVIATLIGQTRGLLELGIADGLLGDCRVWISRVDALIEGKGAPGST